MLFVYYDINTKGNDAESENIFCRGAISTERFMI